MTQNYSLEIFVTRYCRARTAFRMPWKLDGTRIYHKLQMYMSSEKMIRC